LDSQPCVYTVFTSAGKGHFSPRKLEYVVDFAQEQGLKLKGDARGNLLASVLEEGQLTGFFEVWVPYETGDEGRTGDADSHDSVRTVSE
jgi:hypothetical protein